MVIRDVDDPETAARLEPLRAAVDEVLGPGLARMSSGLRHAASGNDKAASFAPNFALLARQTTASSTGRVI